MGNTLTSRTPRWISMKMYTTSGLQFPYKALPDYYPSANYTVHWTPTNAVIQWYIYLYKYILAKIIRLIVNVIAWSNTSDVLSADAIILTTRSCNKSNDSSAMDYWCRRWRPYWDQISGTIVDSGENVSWFDNCCHTLTDGRRTGPCGRGVEAGR